MAVTVCRVEDCQSDWGYGCGFYAYKSKDDAEHHSMPPGADGAVAKVLLSGKVIEHEKGYRAEKLEVVEYEPIDSYEVEMWPGAGGQQNTQIWLNGQLLTGTATWNLNP